MWGSLFLCVDAQTCVLERFAPIGVRSSGDCSESNGDVLAVIVRTVERISHSKPIQTKGKESESL